MTTYVNRTMILPSTLAPLARSLASALAGDAAADMWTVGLSPTGEEPATHYVSSGAVGVEFEAALTDAEVLYAACQAAEAPAPVTLEQCRELVDGAVVSDGTVETLDEAGDPVVVEEGPFQTFERLGLKIVAQETA